jgi:hypothetical protein
MILQVWHDEPAIKALGVEVASVGFWLTSDTTKPLPDSFALTINARVLGLQVGDVTVEPLQNGAVSMPLLESLGGTVQGKIDDWRALDGTGNVVDIKKDPNWRTATSVGFSITAVADVTLNAGAITAVIPGLGGLAAAALAILGKQVKISVAHQLVLQTLPHGAAQIAFSSQAPELTSV